MDIEYLGKGCLRQPSNPRNIPYERVMGATPMTAPIPSEYSLLDEVGDLRVNFQNGSLSCVGQSISKYAEILNWYDLKKATGSGGWTGLSPRFVYSNIFLPEGGAYIADGFKLLVKTGVAREDLVPSYPSDEASMRQKLTSPEIMAVAGLYKAKAYTEITHHGIAETIQQAILQNHGAVTGVVGSNLGWQNEYPREPLVGEKTWGHAILLIGWKEISGSLYWFFVNSWGGQWGKVGGYGYLSHKYFCDFGFNVFTMVDVPMELIKQLYMEWIILPSGEQFMSYPALKIAYGIPDAPEVTILKTRGLQGSPKSVANLDGYRVYSTIEVGQAKGIVSQLKDKLNV